VQDDKIQDKHGCDFGHYSFSVLKIAYGYLPHTWEHTRSLKRRRMHSKNVYHTDGRCFGSLFSFPLYLTLPVSVFSFPLHLTLPVSVFSFPLYLTLLVSVFSFPLYLTLPYPCFLSLYISHYLYPCLNSGLKCHFA
jgi:hypothetical protein